MFDQAPHAPFPLEPLCPASDRIRNILGPIRGGCNDLLEHGIDGWSHHDMMTDTRLGTCKAILAPHTSEIQAIAEALRELIGSLHPDSFETPRIGEGGMTYGIGPKKMTDAYANIMLHKEYVNLGFYRGTALSDPQGLLVGTGKRARHVKLTDVQTVGSPAIRALILASIEERKTATIKG